MPEFKYKSLFVKQKDISNPLYKYWIFYRNYNNGSVLPWQMLKVFTVIAMNIMNVIRCAYYLYKSEPNKMLPAYFMDLFQYIFPSKEYFYILCIILCNLSVILIITL